MARRLRLTGTLRLRPARRPRFLAGALVVAIVGSTLASGAAASASGFSNANDLYGYKIATDIAKTGAGFNPNMPAAYWTGSSWISQQMWAEDQVKAGQRNIVAMQASPAVAKVSYATQSQGAGAVTKVLTPTAVAEAKSKYKLPAFAAAPMLKKVGAAAGGAATAFTGWTVGTAIGNAGTSLFGLDSNGLVCQSDAAGFLAPLTGQSCADFAATDGQPLNDDVTGGYGTQPLCKAGVCIAVTSKPFYRKAYAHQGVICMSVSGNNGNNPGDVGNVRVNSNSRYGSFSVGVDELAIGPGDASVCGVTPPARGQATKFVFAFAQGIPGAAPSATREEALAQTDPGSWVIECLRPNDVEGCGAGALTPTQGSADPDRVLTCTITGDDGNDYTAQSVAFKETDGTWPAPACPTLPEGVGAQNLKIVQDGGGVKNVLTDRPAEQGYRDALAAYPECQTGLCTLELVRTVPAIESCFDLGDACNGWFQDAQKETKYACTYGAHKLSLNSCNVYAQLFDPAKRAAGQPYADPTTGAGTPGVQTGPTASGEAFKKPVQDPGGMRDCLGASTLSNPVSLVMVPVQCALEWAFVPREAVLMETAVEAKGSWDDTVVYKTVAAVTAWDFKPVMTGCNGMAVDLGMFSPGGGEVRVANACPGEPLEQAAFYGSWALTLLTGVVCAMLIASYMGWTVGYKGPADA